MPDYVVAFLPMVGHRCYNEKLNMLHDSHAGNIVVDAGNPQMWVSQSGNIGSIQKQMPIWFQNHPLYPDKDTSEGGTSRMSDRSFYFQLNGERT